MKYKDLRDFIAQLERMGELKRVSLEVDPRLEMTEFCDRVLKREGPAILFEKPKGHSIPVLGNLFGTVRRVALGMGEEDPARLREIGRLLAYLKEPEPPKGLKDAWEKWPILKQVLNMAPRETGSAPCQDIVWEGKDVDLSRLPIQTCWPNDAGPLITWGLTVTKGPHKQRQNLGIYRQQVIAPNKVIMRWRIAAAPWISAISSRPIPSSPFRWRWPWAPTPPPSSVQSRRCRTRCRNTSSPGYCADRKPKW